MSASPPLVCVVCEQVIRPGTDCLWKNVPEERPGAFGQTTHLSWPMHPACDRDA